MKHRHIAKKYWDNKSTPMGEVDVLAKKYNDVINLSLGDPDITTDEKIIEFAFNEARAGHTKYTDFRGDKELRDEISYYYKERFNVDIKDEEIMVSASACLGMYLALESVLDDGDEVIIHSPYFTPYLQQIELAGGVAIELITKEEEGFDINTERLKSLITNKTKVIVINSPNNPTGKVISKETLKKVVDIALENDILIISDEIYTIYTFDKPFVSLINFEEIRDNLIVLNSFSKDFTMTGWRIGNIIAPKHIIEICQAVNENVVFTAPSISQRAAIYALKNRFQIQAKFLNLYKDRVMYAYERIKKIEWMSVLKPEGTFYLLINIKKTNRDALDISKQILDKAQVLSIPGDSFGKGGEGYIRIACTVDKQKLKEAFDRIEKITID